MEPLLSAKALAALLGIAEQTIYNRQSTGGNLPPSIKLGRLLRFRPSDVESWLNSQQVRHVAQPPAARPVARRRPGRPTKAEQVSARGAR